MKSLQKQNIIKILTKNHLINLMLFVHLSRVKTWDLILSIWKFAPLCQYSKRKISTLHHSSMHTGPYQSNAMLLIIVNSLNISMINKTQQWCLFGWGNFCSLIYEAKLKVEDKCNMPLDTQKYTHKQNWL
jgi:hypothetical protein